MAWQYFSYKSDPKIRGVKKFIIGYAAWAFMCNHLIALIAKAVQKVRTAEDVKVEPSKE